MTVVESTTAQQLLECQTRVFNRRLLLPAPKAHLIALIVDSVGRVGIDLVVEEGIVAGASEAVEAYGVYALHRLARAHRSDFTGTVDDHQEDVAVHRNQSQRAVCVDRVQRTVVVQVHVLYARELDHAAGGACAIAAQRRRGSVRIGIVVGRGGAVAEDEDMRGRAEGDCAVGVFFDQHPNGHGVALLRC